MDESVLTDANLKLNISALLQAFAASSPLPVAAVQGALHTICYANPAFCLLIGRSREQLVGNAFCEVVPAKEPCTTLLDRVKKTGTAEIYRGPEDPNLHLLFWSYAMWPVTGEDGDVVAIVLTVTETSDFHQQVISMNEALIVASVHQHELTEKAEMLNQQLRRANKDLEQFAFAANHDLQEPLRMVTTYSQLLVKGYRGQLDSEAATCVSFITKGAKHMRDLLTDLLSYAEAGVDRGETPECIDLNTVLEKVKQNLQPAIEESSALVTAEHLPEIQGQGAHLVQLFQNLISNAIKYRGARSPDIHISTDQRTNVWRFSVSDNGIGIAPEHHQKIFGAFKRLHGPSLPGTGMGLAICQRVVERYGGSIWVESELGRGSTFHFTLPTHGRNP